MKQKKTYYFMLIERNYDKFLYVTSEYVTFSYISLNLLFYFLTQ